jgi:hypothetical protein
MSPDAHLNADLTGQAPDVIGVLRRQWPIIALCGMAAAIIAYMYVSTAEVVYESKSTILLNALPSEVAPGGGRERTLDVETQATVARSTQLLQTIGDELNLTASDVKSASRVEAAPTGDVMIVYFTDDEAVFAAEGALVYSNEFLKQRKATADQAAQDQVELVQVQIDALDAKVNELTEQIDALIRVGDEGSELTVLQQRQGLAIRDLSTASEQLASIDTDLDPGRVVVDPRTAVNRTGLRKPFAVGGGLIVGLLVGVILGMLRDRRDDRYGSAVGLDGTGIQEIGRLRYPSDVRSLGQRLEIPRRDYARLLVRLGFASGVHASGCRTIMLVAVESVTMPQQAMRAVADALAAQGPDNGLYSAVISPERSMAEARALLEPPELPNGQSGSSLVRTDIVDSSASYWNKFAANLAAEMNGHDIVLVAAGAFDRSVAALAVASKVDQTVLLISEATRVADIASAIEDLESVDAREIGVVVLTRVPPRRKWG